MKYWKIYLYFMVTLYFFSLITILSKPNVSKWFDIIVCTISLISLYGFSFKKKFLTQIFWKITCIICVAAEIWDIVKYIPSITTSMNTLFLSLIYLSFIIPIYIAMFLYAFKQNDLWKNKNNGEIITSI
jgi:hypothetical protein